MMKVMLFIDGSWLYANTPNLSATYGDPNFRVDFGKLPRVLGEEVARQLGGVEVDVVRTYLFGSCAANYDSRDEMQVQKQHDFFDMLKEEYQYEVEVFPTDFRGRRVRRADRDERDGFEPKEKCVDIALAATVMYLAAIPHAYDIAILVVGDRDFVPMLQNVRRLGKRVAIASVKESCAGELADSRDRARVKDFDIIWIGDLLQKLELKYERHQLKCESPDHKGNPLVWTTYHPRKGKRFYCEACREEYARQNTSLQQEQLGAYSPAAAGGGDDEYRLDVRQFGVITNIVRDRGFGFIAANDGQDYFFHFTDLAEGLSLDELEREMEVDFFVKRPPSNGKAGAARSVGENLMQDHEADPDADLDMEEEPDPDANAELEEEVEVE